MTINAPAAITSKRNGKVRGRNLLNFRMFPPKARRITPLVTIPIGMARLFFRFFLGGTRCPQRVGKRTGRRRPDIFAFGDSLAFVFGEADPPRTNGCASFEVLLSFG